MLQLSAGFLVDCCRTFRIATLALASFPRGALYQNGARGGGVLVNAAEVYPVELEASYSEQTIARASQVTDRATQIPVLQIVNTSGAFGELVLHLVEEVPRFAISWCSRNQHVEGELVLRPSSGFATIMLAQLVCLPRSRLLRRL